MSTVILHSERVEAMCRLLIESGDMTPIAVMQLRKLWETSPEEDTLRSENDRLREALQDIFLASRDGGLAHMVNWIRGRAMAALREEGK